MPEVLPTNAPSSSVTTKMAGFATFGCLVRAFQLYIQKQPLSKAPQTYLYSVVAYSGIGYLWYHAEARQKQLLAKAEAEIDARRAKQRESLSSGLGNAIPQ